MIKQEDNKGSGGAISHRSAHQKKGGRRKKGLGGIEGKAARKGKKRSLKHERSVR